MAAIVSTLFVYLFFSKIHQRFQLVQPVIFTSFFIMGCLFVFTIPYEGYKTSTQNLTDLLTPATVALGVPLYKQLTKLKSHLLGLFAVILSGSLVSMMSAGGIAYLMGADFTTIMSVIPRSVTTPIAIEISKNLQGDPTITAALVLLSGFLGSLMGPKILKLTRINHEHAIGCAIGTSSHALGTAALMRKSESQGAVSSLAMALAGILTSFMASVMSWLFFK